MTPKELREKLAKLHDEKHGEFVPISTYNGLRLMPETKHPILTYTGPGGGDDGQEVIIRKDDIVDVIAVLTALLPREPKGEETTSKPAA